MSDNDWHIPINNVKPKKSGIKKVALKKPKQEENNLLSHARKELELLKEEPETIEAYLRVIQAFRDMGHSGSSATVSIPVINALLLFKNLTPLTDDPDEWMHISANVWDSQSDIWQSKRCPDAFSTDGGKTYYLLSEGAHSRNQRPSHGTLKKVQE